MRESVRSAALLAVVGTLSCPATGLGQWRADVAGDPVTGARIEYAVATGSGGESGVVGTPTISVYCDDGAVLYLESSGTFLAPGGDSIPVDMRVDENDPISVPFLANTDGTGGTTTDRAVLRVMVPEMRAGSRMLVRAQDFLGIHYEYSFTLIGFTAATEEMDCLTAALERPIEVAEEEARIVGHRITRFWYRIEDSCWRQRIPAASRIFFRSLGEANAAGYIREGLPCGE